MTFIAVLLLDVHFLPIVFMPASVAGQKFVASQRPMRVTAPPAMAGSVATTSSNAGSCRRTARLSNPAQVENAGPAVDSASPLTRIGRPSRTCLSRTRAASSRIPWSWLAPPVRTTRRPAYRATPEACKRSRTSSKVSSIRGRTIPTSIERDTCAVAPSSSSPTIGTSIV